MSTQHHCIWTFIIATPLLAAGCAATMPKSEDAAYSRVPAGSLVRVERRLPVAKDKARVWLRGVRTSAVSSSDSPICALEVARIDREGTQYIEPGEFRIRRVENMWTQVVQARPEGPERLKLRLAGMDGGDGGTPMIYEGYHFWFERTEQPNLMRMTCIGVFDDMWEAKPPTITEIRASLGNLATLELATTTAS